MGTQNIEKMINGISDLAVKNAIDAADSVSMTLTPDFLVVKFKNAQTLPTTEGAPTQEGAVVPNVEPAVQSTVQPTVQPGVQPTEETAKDPEIEGLNTQLTDAFKDVGPKTQNLMDQIKGMLQAGKTEDEVKAFVEAQSGDVTNGIATAIQTPAFQQVLQATGGKPLGASSGTPETTKTLARTTPGTTPAGMTSTTPETTETTGTTPESTVTPVAPGQGLPTGV